MKNLCVASCLFLIYIYNVLAKIKSNLGKLRYSKITELLLEKEYFKR